MYVSESDVFDYGVAVGRILIDLFGEGAPLRLADQIRLRGAGCSDVDRHLIRGLKRAGKREYEVTGRMELEVEVRFTVEASSEEEAREKAEERLEECEMDFNRYGLLEEEGASYAEATFTEITRITEM